MFVCGRGGGGRVGARLCMCACMCVYLRGCVYVCVGMGCGCTCVYKGESDRVEVQVGVKDGRVGLGRQLFVGSQGFKSIGERQGATAGAPGAPGGAPEGVAVDGGRRVPAPHQGHAALAACVFASGQYLLQPPSSHHHMRPYKQEAQCFHQVLGAW